VLVRLAEIWLQAPFLHLIYFIKKFYEFFTLNAICKDDGAINSITVLHKKFHYRQL
jgi:hypothetical protein